MANLRTELKTELEAAGMFDDHPWTVYGKFVLLVACAIGLFVLTFRAESWWLQGPLFIAASFAAVGALMVGHDSGHGAISRNKLVNDLLGYVAFPFMGGMPITYWKWKHNMLHHSYPNVVGKDGDIDIYPFAMHSDQRKTKGISGFVQRHQSLMFWPIASFTTASMRVDGLVWLLGRGQKLAPRRDRMIDLACTVLHYATWLVAPVLLGASIGATIGFYLAFTAISGLLLAAIFLPAHLDLPFYKGYDENFVLQLRTTQNLRTNPLFSFLMIGLDHQVEHHLFQRMSHLSAKRAAPIVKAFCARRGLPYYEADWGRALWSTTLRFGKMPFYDAEAKPPPADGAVMASDPVYQGPSEYSRPVAGVETATLLH